MEMKNNGLSRGVEFRVLGVLLSVFLASTVLLCAVGCSPQSSGPVYLLESQIEYKDDGSLFRSTSFEYDEYGNVVSHKQVVPDAQVDGWYWVYVGIRNNIKLDDHNTATSWSFSSDSHSADDLAKAQSHSPDFDENYASSHSLKVTYGGGGEVTDIATDYLTAHFSDGMLVSLESSTWSSDYTYEDTSEGETITVNSRPLSVASRYLDHEETTMITPTDSSEKGNMTTTSFFTEYGTAGGNASEASTYEITFDENGCPVCIEDESGAKKELTWKKIDNPNPLAKMDNKRIVATSITPSLLPTQ